MKSPADKQRRSRLLQRRRSLFLEFLEARNLLAGVQAFSGDFNQDGVDTLGLFDPASSEVYLRDENSPGFPQTAFQFPGATATDQALAGNWTGSGRDTVALFNSVDGRVLLANGNSSGATTSFHFTGLPASTLPVAGDWNNSGHDSLAAYDPATYQFLVKTTFQDGPADQAITFWPAGFNTAALADFNNTAAWRPLAGNFIPSAPGDEIALYDTRTGDLYARSTTGGATVQKLGAFHPANFSTNNPLAGDWGGSKTTGLGFYDANTGVTTVKNTLPDGPADASFYVVPSTSTVPLVGAAQVNYAAAPVKPQPAIHVNMANVKPGLASSFHNADNPGDVNQDGGISIVDVLALVNWINRPHGAPASGEGEGGPSNLFPDVNNDGSVSPTDVLLLVNAFNLANLAAANTTPMSTLATPTDTASQVITSNEVQQFLNRGAAASAGNDGIIAVVDRGGNILGVRVESGVTLTGDALVFAIDGAVSEARTAAFFSSDQAPLTSRTVRSLSQTTITQREVEATPDVPNVADSTTYGPGFVAPIGVGGHFPPGVQHTPPVDLFGIEGQSRDTSATLKMGNDRFNVDSAWVTPGSELASPDSYGVQSGKLMSAISRGIGTLPGGIPLFKQTTGDAMGHLVGGIGVFFPGPDGYATHEQNFQPDADPSNPSQSALDRMNAPKALEAEWIAFAAAGGSTMVQSFIGVNGVVGDLGGVPPVPGYNLPFGRIDLVGITLEIVGPNPTADNPQSGVETILGVGNAVGRGNPLGGVNELVDPSATDATAYAKNGKKVPEGWLVNPHGSISGDHLITQSVVESIVSQSIAQANKTRAAIRLTPDAQPGVPTKMVIAVADKDGNVLGLYRMHDATVFSIDVAVAKARNTAYYTDPTKLQPQDKIDDDLLVARGDLTPSQIASYGVTLNGLGTPDLYQNSASTQPFSTAGGYAASNRTFRFLAEPRYPSGVDDTLPPIFSILNDHNSDLNTGTNPLNAENLGAPAPVSQFQSVLGYSAFHPGANFRDPLRVDLQNGIVFFPGSTPLFTSTALAGGFGISGDGVDQDDVVTFAGAQGYSAPIAIQADQAFYRGVRLPFQKFNRNPQGLS